MHIQFCGANHEVTGSCHLLKAKQQNILVDCGLFQGGNYNEGKNFDAFPFNPSDIDVLLVTHAHLDHVGRIPKLVNEGFSGQIFATRGTIPMMEIVLKDSARIMKYNHRKFQSPILYTEEDVDKVMALTVPVDYYDDVNIGHGTAVWKDAGHILGSAFIEVSIDGKKIAFSGDIGNENTPILRDTDPLSDDVDVLLIESTYGDRLHEERELSSKEILEHIHHVVENNGVVMIPAFSIERTQELLYGLDSQFEAGKLPEIPIFLDSPMAIKITEIFKQFPEYYDVEACKQYLKGEDFLDFPNLEFTPTRDESKRINTTPTPKMIIAGAGMMNGGRILHHAHRYLPDPASELLLIGYQAQGTTGRRLYEGAEHVKIFGDKVPVNAKVKAIGGLSAHGDQKKLLDWVGNTAVKPKKIYCVHGEPNAATELAHRLRDAYDIPTYYPEYAEEVEVS